MDEVELEEDDVDVTKLVFEGEGDDDPKLHARSRSIASMSSAALTDEVSGHSSGATGNF